MQKVGDLKREEGQAMAEYGVSLSVITLLVVGTIGFLSGQLQAVINAVGNLL